MQRFDNESFDAYKERRKAANMAVKRMNWQSNGGTVSARTFIQLRRDQLEQKRLRRGMV